MNEMAHQQMVADVARSLIEQVAPQELPLFRATSAAYFKNPRRAMAGQSGRDEMLGFGGGGEATFVTPIVLIAATKVVEFARQSSPAVPTQRRTGLLGRFRNKRQQDEQQTLPALTPAQVARAREVALETLREHNFPEDQREVVADRLIAQLLVAGA